MIFANATENILMQGRTKLLSCGAYKIILLLQENLHQPSQLVRHLGAQVGSSLR